jgi:hypothetical protein
MDDLVELESRVAVVGKPNLDAHWFGRSPRAELRAVGSRGIDRLRRRRVPEVERACPHARNGLPGTPRGRSTTVLFRAVAVPALPRLLLAFMIASQRLRGSCNGLKIVLPGSFLSSSKP